MSRTRIVMGNYTKITGGNHNMYSEKSIVTEARGNIVENGKENGVIHGTPERPPEQKDSDFDIKFSLNRESKHTTVVPFGILDFSGKDENAFFIFNYSLHIGNVDSLSFKIYDQDNVEVYGIINLPEIVVTASKYPLLLQKKEEAKPKANDGFNSNIWHWKPLYEQYINAASDYTKIGSYLIFWDGFDNNNIYDSARFNNKKFTAVLTGKKGGKVLTRKVEFSTEYNQVDWVDVKIDKNTKKIDATLRVNLKDGGEEGLSCKSYSVGEEAVKQITVCDWDKIPKDVLAKFGQTPIKTRSRSFEYLKKLVIEGTNYHWGRNKNHFIAKKINLFDNSFGFYLNTVIAEKQSIGELKLIFNTNGSWMRSGNPGTIKDPLSLGGNIFSRQAICYNTGYIKYENGWGFQQESNENLEFKDTSAHEIGHEILKKYGGTFYSYGHKGSVNSIWQSLKEEASELPLEGEIDLMPYFKNNKLGNESAQPNYYLRRVAAENDVLGLIWLTKILLK